MGFSSPTSLLVWHLSCCSLVLTLKGKALSTCLHETIPVPANPVSLSSFFVHDLKTPNLFQASVI